MDPARALLADLQALGEQRTNPVLPLLGEPPRIVRGVRYPRRALRFGECGLRAYYHSHADPWRRDDEHGHFHLFLPAGSEWSHLAALSIDGQGQPQAWFTVNRWVTAGPWCEPTELLTALDRFLACAGEAQGLSLTERWLTHMLGLWRPQLPALLEARDARLAERSAGRPPETVWQDRNIYTLSRQPVELLATLAERLGLDSGEPPSGADAPSRSPSTAKEV